MSVHHPAGVSARVSASIGRRSATRADHGIALAWQRGDQLPTLQRLIELASELVSSDDA